jgi:hypothetical protein
MASVVSSRLATEAAFSTAISDCGEYDRISLEDGEGRGEPQEVVTWRGEPSAVRS